VHGPLSKLVNKLLVLGSRLSASFALKRDLLALRFDGKMPRLRR
jgi:hypothetical protein